MSRNLLIAISLLTSYAAMAALPAVNDMAETEYSKIAYITVAGKVKKIEAVSNTVKIELTSYDGVKNEYTVKRTISQSGASTVDTYVQAATAIVSDAQLIDILTNCDKQGGVPEKLTLAAGVFDVCTITRADEKDATIAFKTSYSYVPFGIVYQETSKNGKVTDVARLKTFTMQDN